jgi:hypothetical protein
MIDANVAKPFCIVLGDGFPNWLFHVSALGYQVEHVLLTSPCYVSLIHKICGADVPVWCGSNLADLLSGLSLQVKSIVVLLDGRITMGLLDTLGCAGFGDVISTQTPRRPCRGWQSMFVNVPHTKVRGVTTRVVLVVWHSKTALTGLPLPVEITAQRDAATVLSHSTFGRYFCPKPNSILVEPLRCLNLGSSQHPYYHGHGWLPMVLDRNIQVLMPVLNSRMNARQWGLRTLSSEEVLLCNDIGSAAVAVLLSKRQHNTFYSGLVPGKCLLAGFHSLFYGGVQEWGI